MIKLKSLLKEQFTDLGRMKVPIQLVDMYYSLHQNEKGDIYAYPVDQTRLFKALDKFGEKATVEPLLNKINNKYGDCGYFRLATTADPGKPLIFLYTPND
jgi:hypothetical protein